MTQNEALEILKLGHNVYLTGSAGSGKTYLLNKYVGFLKSAGASIGITASTGIAASHIGGVTIHSWAGIGIKDRLSKGDLSDLRRNNRVHHRLAKAAVLIIDEISMLDAKRLDLADIVCRRLREDDRPFGGLQVVLCGDFFQLPPVNRGPGKTDFAPASAAWQELDLKVCYLTEQHRQTDDGFLKVLNDIRSGLANDETKKILASRQDREPAGDVFATKLYSHNFNVDAVNDFHLAQIDEESRVYPMSGYGSHRLIADLKKSCLAKEDLELKEGAAVMFVKNNFEEGYTNGTLGTVVGFDEGSGYPVVRIKSGRKIIASPVSWAYELDGEVIAVIRQVPLRLAWAITIHKSQGMSLDAAEIDLSRSFERGMGYVALSRVRSLSGIKLLGLNDLAIRVNEEILRLDQDLMAQSETLAAQMRAADGAEIGARQAAFLRAISSADGENKGESKKASPKKAKGETYQETKKLVLQKMSLADMAAARGLVEGTIISHLEKLSAGDKQLDLDYLRPDSDRLETIGAAFKRTGDIALAPVRDLLGEDFSFEELRLARLVLRLL